MLFVHKAREIVLRVLARFRDVFIYYDTVAALLHYHHAPRAGRLPPSILSLLLIITLTTVRVVFLFLSPLFPPLVRILLCDPVQIVHLKSADWLMVTFLHLLCTILYLRLYPLRGYDRHFHTLLLVSNVLAQSSSTPRQNFHANVAKIVNFDHRFRLFIFLVLGVSFVSLQAGLLADNMMVVGEMFHSVVKVFIFELNVIVAMVCFFYMSTIFIDFNLLMIIFSLWVFEQFRRCERRHTVAKELSVHRAECFMSGHNFTFQQVASFNHVCRWVLLSIMVVNIPSNAYLIINLTTGINTAGHLLLQQVILIANQYSLIVFIHLLAVRHSTAIHGFAINMLGRLPRLRWRSVVARLRLAHYIERFHTKPARCYGMTYGRFGLINMATFVKFLFIYIRFLFYFYKTSQRGR